MNKLEKLKAFINDDFIYDLIMHKDFDDSVGYINEMGNRLAIRNNILISDDFDLQIEMDEKIIINVDEKEVELGFIGLDGYKVKIQIIKRLPVLQEFYISIILNEYADYWTIKNIINDVLRKSEHIKDFLIVIPEDRLNNNVVEEYQITLQLKSYKSIEEEAIQKLLLDVEGELFKVTNVRKNKAHWRRLR
jgi:hypothetical protein